MPAIRLPQSAEPLLPFCRRSGDPADNACFDTYADLVTFAASCGFHRLQGRRPKDPDKFHSAINPIDLGIFKNQGLYPNLLLIGMGCEQKPDIARDEEQLCRLAEAFADVGFKYLGHELCSWTPARFHLEMAKLLYQEASETMHAQI